MALKPRRVDEAPSPLPIRIDKPLATEPVQTRAGQGPTERRAREEAKHYARRLYPFAFMHLAESDAGVTMELNTPRASRTVLTAANWQGLRDQLVSTGGSAVRLAAVR